MIAFSQIVPINPYQNCLSCRRMKVLFCYSKQWYFLRWVLGRQAYNLKLLQEQKPGKLLMLHLFGESALEELAVNWSFYQNSTRNYGPNEEWVRWAIYINLCFVNWPQSSCDLIYFLQWYVIYWRNFFSKVRKIGSKLDLSNGPPKTW